MITVQDILTELVDKVPDSRFSETWLITKINQAISDAARQVLLPALEASGSFTTSTSTNLVSIPVALNYSRGLHIASVNGTGKITVLSSLQLLQTHYPNVLDEVEQGDIEFITVLNRSFLYYPVPTVETTVYVSYYKRPDILSKSDELTMFDDTEEGLIERLVMSYVLWQMYSKIEDGAEGPMPNTSGHKSAYMECIYELDSNFDVGQSYRPPDRETGWI
jgi:hypothetical protein